MYHIYTDGFRVTETPMTLKEIIESFGEIRLLERQGFRLVKVS